MKQNLSIIFQSQITSQAKRQNNIMQAYLWVFVNYKYNNLAKRLSIAQLVYINAKNISTSYTLLKLNCSFHFRVFNKKDVNYCSKSEVADKLVGELKEQTNIR